MRYRRLSDTGDRTFGQGGRNFWQDQPEAVGQAAETRLGLFLGQWFLDVTEGTDWNGKVLGERRQITRDAEIRTRILETPGCNGITSYSVEIDPIKRAVSVQVEIDTIYGQTALVDALVASLPVVLPSTAPTRLVAPDGTILLGADGAQLFDPKLPLP